MHAAPRSYLFVPANRPDRFDKALASPADRVILDLEDAVPAHEKSSGRESIAQWLGEQHRVIVRINAAGTEWFDDDLLLCHRPGVVGVMLPKSESPAQIDAVRSALPGVDVLPLVESARGIAAVGAIAAASGVRRLVFGSIDLQLDLGICGDDDELLLFRSQLVLASRLAGIEPPVDGVVPAFDDVAAMRDVARSAQRARRLGFGAKLCIHPRQVDAVNEAFSPSGSEIAWARRVLEAAERSGGAAVALDGTMIDKPLVLRAQAVLSRAGLHAPPWLPAGGGA
jgi:citrate lyase subunit beta / citryl-CoA lyase